MSDRRILLVGLGTIARTHLGVLRRRADVTVVGGVDPAPGPDLGLPVHATVADALAAGTEPDLVVVATPTDTHPAVVAEVLDTTTALVLSEKPLARDLAGIERLRADRPGLEARVAVAHHFAFSPEVAWARRQVAAHPEWGAPEHVLSVFNDPYAGKSPDQLRSYLTPWVDSGPNQLSMLGAFVSGWRPVAAQHEPMRSVVTLDHDGGTSVLTSNWLAGDTSKQTTLEFRGGSVRLRIDHTSMTGLVVEDGRVTAHAGYGGTLSRKDAHYTGLYDVLLADPADHRLSVALAADVARLLEEGARVEEAAVRWGDVAG